MLTTVWSMHIPLVQDTMQLRSGRTIPKPTQWPAVRMTAAAVARAAAITNATKVWNLGFCWPVPTLLRSVLPTLNEDGCSTGCNMWMLLCRSQPTQMPLHQVP